MADVPVDLVNTPSMTARASDSSGRSTTDENRVGSNRSRHSDDLRTTDGRANDSGGIQEMRDQMSDMTYILKNIAVRLEALEKPEPRSNVDHPRCAPTDAKCISRQNRDGYSDSAGDTYRHRQMYMDESLTRDQVQRRDLPTYDWSYSSHDYQPSAPQVKIKMPAYNGKTRWETWIAQFEAIGRRQGWTEDDKLDHLLPRLEGVAAQFVFEQLPTSTIHNYPALIEELSSRFRVIETPRSFAVKFGRRVQCPGEPVERYASELKYLYDMAYRNRPRYIRDEDLVRKFLDGLINEHVKYQVEFNKDPKTIDEAVYYAVHATEMAGVLHNRGERPRQARRITVNDENDGVSDGDNRCYRTIQALQERIRKLEENRGVGKERRNRRPVEKVQCYSCREKGHYARQCTGRADPNQSSATRDSGVVIPTTTTADGAATDDSLNWRGPCLAARGWSRY